MNLLRASLTIIIIGFGIMSLVSMLTAVDGIKNALYENFAAVGSNTFSISNVNDLENMSRHGLQSKSNRSIRYVEAQEFKTRMNGLATVSISVIASGNAVAQSELAKTAPKIQVTGSDENYLTLNG